MFGVGLISGMYISSQIEKSIDNNINNEELKDLDEIDIDEGLEPWFPEDENEWKKIAKEVDKTIEAIEDEPDRYE